MTDAKVVQYQVQYDRKSDVLYISRMPPMEGVVEEGLPGVLWRYSAVDGSIVGVTILDFTHCWTRRLDYLAHDLVNHLNISQHQAKLLLELSE